MGRWCSTRVEVACDLGQAPARGTLCLEAFEELGRYGCGSAPCRRWSRAFSSGPSLFFHQPPQLVDRNQLGAPRQLNRLDERQDAPVEGRAADPECRGSLRARVGKALDTGRLSNDLDGSFGLRGSVSLSLLAPTSQTTTGHLVSVHKP